MKGSRSLCQLKAHLPPFNSALFCSHLSLLSHQQCFPLKLKSISLPLFLSLRKCLAETEFCSQLERIICSTQRQTTLNRKNSWGPGAKTLRGGCALGPTVSFCSGRLTFLRPPGVDQHCHRSHHIQSIAKPELKSNSAPPAHTWNCKLEALTSPLCSH